MEGSHSDLPDRVAGIAQEKMATSNKNRDEAETIVNFILSLIPCNLHDYLRFHDDANYIIYCISRIVTRQ